MNTETGEIRYFEEGTEILKNYTEINKNDMTTKQNREMQVSKKDNKSKLGKIFTTARAKRKWIAKQVKKQNQS